MFIIVDGYNVLKQLIAHDHISETERLAFVGLLGRYAKKRGHKIEIVFDKGPCIYPMKEKYHGVTVVFSGEYKTADDIIIAFCREHQAKDILVVTKDRAIIQAVTSGNCEVVDPKIFYDKVKAVFQKSSEAREYSRGFVAKLTEKKDEEIDALMLEAAEMTIPLKDDNETISILRHHQVSGNNLSKKELKKHKKIDKL